MSGAAAPEAAALAGAAGVEEREALAGLTLALVAAVGFSAKAILVKLAYREGVDAVTLLALRMGLAAPFFAIAALWSRRRHAQPVAPGDRLWIVVLGLAGYYLSSYLDFLGLQYVSAGLERLILFLYPTITVLLAAALQRRAVSRSTWTAMAVCYAGIVLVFLHDVGRLQGSLVLGSALVFGSTLSYSAYLVGAGEVIGRVGAVRFTALASLVASAASLGQFAVARPWSALEVSWRVAGLGAGMAVFSTVLPVFLLSFAIRRIGPGRASLVGSIGPVSTILLAYLFLQESMSLLQLAGSALVLAGVLMVGRAR